MNTGDMLLRAILCDPGDDTARLAFADYLEENGEADRAELVRVQVELSAPPKPRAEVEREAVANFTARMSRLERGDPNLRNLVAIPKHRAWAEHLRAVEGRITRSRQLCVRVGLDSPMEGWEVWPTPFLPAQERMWAGCRGPATAHRRGFVDEVRLPAAAFTEGFARGLFSRHPVTRVVLTDREPWRNYGHAAFSWSGRGTPGDSPPQNCRVPESWLDILDDDPEAEFKSITWVGFTTPESAAAALSRTAVAWGRELAGLPPLPHASGGA